MKKNHSPVSRGIIGRSLTCRKGFTLIEMALVLVLVGVLLSMGVELLPMLIKQSKLSENRSIVKNARTAIIGYAQATGRLPTASSDTDGDEDSGVYRGYLPYVTLGISGNDSYTHTLFYAVDPYLTDTDPATPEGLKKNLGQLISSGSSIGPYYREGAVDIHVSFVVLSAGANGRADSVNDDNNNGVVAMAGDDYRFEKPGAPETATYDDILDALSLTDLNGRIPID